MNHQIGQYRGVANRPEKGGMKHLGSGKSEHSKEGHPADSALVPHPQTGVTKVEIAHKGEGRYETKTHHEGGGEPEVQQHHSIASATDHAEQQMPPATGDHEEPDMDDESGAMNSMAGEIGEPS
jgi:hypothetical protein